MSSPSRTILWKVLPAVIFPSLSLTAGYFLFGHLVKAGTTTRLDDQCLPSSPNPLPYRLEYTHLGRLDWLLCGIVAFFHSAMHPSNLPCTTELLVSFSTLTIVPYFEAARSGRSTALAFPLLLALLYQIASAGILLPLYWLAFIWTGAARFHKPPPAQPALTKVDQAHAEAILFSLAIGYLIPTAAMLALEDPQVTAIWQFFPLWMTLSQFAHRFFRPSSRYPYTGYPTVRATYIILFILTSSYHVGIVWPRLRDGALINRLFLPSISFPDPAAATLQSGVLEFLKWDVGIGFFSTALVTLWLARNFRELSLLITWYIVATPLIGPGAVLAAVFLWREALLNSQRPKEIDSKEVKSE